MKFVVVFIVLVGSVSGQINTHRWPNCNNETEVENQCGNRCEPTCDNVFLRTRYCPQICESAACECKNGYARHKGRCIPVRKCPIEGDQCNVSRDLKRWVEDAEKCFHPKQFLMRYYDKTNHLPRNGGGFTDNSLSRIFKKISETTGFPSQSRILEVGSGPSLLLAIYAGQVFDEIYLSDYTLINRNMLQRSIDGTNGGINWWERLDYIRRCNIPIAKNAVHILKSKVKAVLKCDVRIPGVINDNFGKFDAVASLFHLETVTETDYQYETAVKNVIDLVKPSGFYIQSGMFNQTYFNDGAETYFGTLSLSKAKIIDTLTKNGIKIIDLYEKLPGKQSTPPPSGKRGDDDSEGYYIIYGIKQEMVDDQ